MQVAFFCCFRQGVAGMSRDLGRDVPELEKLYARKLWADFSDPNFTFIFNLQRLSYFWGYVETISKIALENKGKMAIFMVIFRF